MKITKIIAPAVASLMLAGCGDSGGGATQQGRFQDTNVDGLSYTGSFPGVTANGGLFMWGIVSFA